MNTSRKGFTIIEVFIAVIGVLALAGVVAGAYVAFHFIQKLW